MRVIWLDETNVLENPAESWETAASLGDAFAALRAAPADVLAVSLPLHACAPAKVLEWSRLYSPATKVLFFREHGSTEEALGLVKQGATHYFDHVPTLDEVLGKGNPYRDQQCAAVKGAIDWRKRLVGQSESIRRVIGNDRADRRTPLDSIDSGRNGHRQGSRGACDSSCEQ